MYQQIQKEKFSQRKQNIAKVVRGVAILACVTAIATVASIGLGIL